MHILNVSDDFWNIRGAFKIGGLLNIGTHASLVKLQSGKFVFLDSLTLTEDVAAQVNALTNDGELVEAVINVHPFHTVHVEAMHKAFPQAKHYGTQRHLERFAHLNWQTERSEDEALHQRYANDFRFSVPRGVDFISKNPNLHFSSVLVYHLASNTIHSDDTLMYTKLPKPIGASVSFHMTLSKTLEKRPGAAADFRQWAAELAEEWGDAKNLCAAHTAALLDKDNKLGPISELITDALKKVDGKLNKHDAKFAA